MIFRLLKNTIGRVGTLEQKRDYLATTARVEFLNYLEECRRRLRLQEMRESIDEEVVSLARLMAQHVDGKTTDDSSHQGKERRP